MPGLFISLLYSVIVAVHYAYVLMHMHGMGFSYRSKPLREVYTKYHFNKKNCNDDISTLSRTEFKHKAEFIHATPKWT